MREPLVIKTQVDVREQRAPTDESVRLLRELEERARANVVASYHFYPDNTFTATVVASDEFVSRTLHYHLVGTLNGRPFESHVVCLYRERMELKTEAEVGRWVVEVFSKALAEQLLAGMKPPTLILRK